VLGRTVRVVFVGDLGDEYLDTRPYSGRFIPAASEIRIDARNPEEEQAEALLHEVLHSVDLAVEAGLKEKQISALSRGLYAVFRDNPKLAGLFCE